MLQLEALIAFIVFLLLLSGFVHLQASELEQARSSRDLFQAQIDAKSYALLVESFYNNVYQEAPERFDFNQLPGCYISKTTQRVNCQTNDENAWEKLESISFLNDALRLKLNEHYH